MRTPATMDGQGGLRCASPGYPSRATLTLEIAYPPLGEEAARLRQHGGAMVRSHSALRFSLYDADAPTAVHTLSPEYGPPLGGTAVTVRGDNFAPGARCYFGEGTGAEPHHSSAASFVSVQLIACRAPAGDRGSVPLTVGDADGGRRGAAATFTYYDPLTPPELHSASPPYATAALADRAPPSVAIAVRGSGFPPLRSSIFCAFGDADTNHSSLGAEAEAEAGAVAEVEAEAEDGVSVAAVNTPPCASFRSAALIGAAILR